MSELTTVQKNVLRYVQERLQAGLPPTRAQIAQHFMWRSANAAQEHLAAIARKGYIRLIGGARGIELVSKDPMVCVHCGQLLPTKSVP
jgi:repressor LexA